MAFYFLIERGKEKHKQDNQTEDFKYILSTDKNPGLFIEFPFEPNVYYGAHPATGKATWNWDDEIIEVTNKHGFVTSKYRKFQNHESYIIWKKITE